SVDGSAVVTEVVESGRVLASVTATVGGVRSVDGAASVAGAAAVDGAASVDGAVVAAEGDGGAMVDVNGNVLGGKLTATTGVEFSAGSDELDVDVEPLELEVLPHPVNATAPMTMSQPTMGRTFTFARLAGRGPCRAQYPSDPHADRRAVVIKG